MSLDSGHVTGCFHKWSINLNHPLRLHIVIWIIKYLRTLHVDIRKYDILIKIFVLLLYENDKIILKKKTTFTCLHDDQTSLEKESYFSWTKSTRARQNMIHVKWLNTLFLLELYLHRNLILSNFNISFILMVYIFDIFSINFVRKGRESEIVRSYINHREFVDHDTYNVSSSD